MQNYILYLAYGNIDNINECRYSLLKYFDQYNSAPPANTTIVIYTDQPAFFKPYIDFFIRIEIKEITPALMREWRGVEDFVFRVKVMSIYDFVTTHTGNFLFCDTDTYITEPLEKLFAEIEQGHFYMHELEGVLGQKGHSYFRKWDKFLSKNTIEYNGKKLIYSKDIQMWNSGILGFNSKYSFLLEDVLSLTDTIYRKFPKHIAEQFSFSYCLQRAGIVNAAKHGIVHYWNLKEFRAVLKSWFDQYQNESIPVLIKKANQFDINRMQTEKKNFQNLHWVQRSLHKMTGRKWDIKNY